MSTVRVNKNTSQFRFAKLLRMNEIVFHANDLANIWQISDKNTLHTTLKRYAQKGLIYRVYRGLYAIKPPEELDPLFLGVKAMHSYCYVSCESILSQAGLIQQKINYITLAGSKSRRFTVNGYNYYSRQLKDEYLFNDAGIIKDNDILTAGPERAVADMLYFNPRFFFDARSRINWKKVEKIQRIIGYKK